MQNNKTSLLFTLVFLCVTLPMLSGCRLSGPIYKTSSWQFYNPFSSKSKDKDHTDLAFANEFDSPASFSLPKQEVAPPPGGYSTQPRDTRVATSISTSRRGASDPMNDLYHAENGRNTGPSGAGGVASSGPKPEDRMVAQTGISSGTPIGVYSGANGMPSSATSSPPLYGTTTLIEPGFSANGGGQLATQQPLTNGTTLYNQPGFGQQPGPGYAQTAQQFAAGQTIPQNPSSYLGQPNDMMPSTSGTPLYQNSNTIDPAFNNFAQSSAPTSNIPPFTSTQVASNHGTGYGGGQPIGYSDPMFYNQTQGSSAQNASSQGTMTQNTTIPATAMPNSATPNTVQPSNGYPQPQMSIPNGQGATDSGYGMYGYSDPANSGMSNPAATGTATYPMYDPNQSTTPTSPQSNPMPAYNGQSFATQPPANNGYQSGFNYYGTSSDVNDYRPGSTTMF